MSETQGLPATEEEPIGELALRTLAMPADTNPSGDIFGGWLMGQMDIAGGIAAGSRAGGRVATVAVDGFTFHKPVHVGDVVCCYTKILRTGRTSVTIRVQAWTLRRHQADVRIKVTEGNFTFVALDENGNKRLVPDH
ncbi:MAG: acyl-CoA thioesterase [Rhodospirillaceae bacterium]|jgi:acyl-CoA thioesterase YciA|nr:acyl-CoA thioesterase [Rhodospirillaceae bacterium]MBT5514639.1 acyl-CoA thioesterase [Rhodospirillaceae bacterium]MBT6883738.1 acyl-CoA thioesterase [Rhodospirillaceae bacterium]